MKLIHAIALAGAASMATGPAVAGKGGYPNGAPWQAAAADFQELGDAVEAVGGDVQMAKDQLADIEAILAGPLEVNIANQPVQVEGAVDASVSGTVQVQNTPGGALDVVIDPQSRAGLSHHHQPIGRHLQFQATSLPIATAAVLDATRITPEGGGQSYDVPDGECLVVTEATVAYINADTSVFPTVSFRMGLTDPGLSSVVGRRILTDVADANDAGVIEKTFPSGIVMKVGDFSPDHRRLGLETFGARVVDFAASGYRIACD